MGHNCCQHGDAGSLCRGDGLEREGIAGDVDKEETAEMTKFFHVNYREFSSLIDVNYFLGGMGNLGEVGNLGNLGKVGELKILS